MTPIPVTLQTVTPVCANTRSFTFTRDDGQAVPFAAGQFYRFVLTDADGDFERSYSLANFSSRRDETLELIVSTVEGGRATRWLWHAEPGSRATVTGPFGRLVLPAPLPRRLVLVATSVGIAPFMPMLAELAGPLARGETSLALAFGVRDETEFLYADLLRAFEARHPAFALTTCFSQALPVTPHAGNVAGRVQAGLARIDPDPAHDHVMLCGNPGMVDDVYATLRDRGFRPRQVVREKYVFAKTAKAGPVTAMTDAQKALLAEKMKRYGKTD